MSKHPLVSVVITAFNYGKFLEEAVASVLNQTYKNIEVIVINDGSTDDTDMVVKNILKTHKEIIYLRQENRGVVGTRNRGIDVSTGAYLLFLDADDHLDPDYIEKTLEMSQSLNADVVYTDFIKFGSEKGKSNFPEFSYEILKNHNFIHISSLIKKEALGGITFDPALASLSHEDWDFFLAIASKGKKVVKCHTTYLRYRIHKKARNNTASDYASRRQYVDIYAYVMDKHLGGSKKAEFEYLTGDVFARWYAALDDKRQRLEEKNTLLSSEIDAIKNSKAYKVAFHARHPKQLLSKAKNSARTLVSDKLLYGLHAASGFKEKYFIDQPDRLTISAAEIAVIIHLGTSDDWSIFRDRLKYVEQPFDLFVSVVEARKLDVGAIKKYYPQANIFVVPDKGRDVLPFMKLAHIAYQQGLKKALKIHAMQPGYIPENTNWAKSVLDDLLPKDKNEINRIINSLDDTAAIIGPSDYYYSLSVNLSLSKAGANRILEMLGHKERLEDIYTNYGYFPGATFWCNLDAIKDTLGFSSRMFEKEEGQTDATFAHAWERAVCIHVELKGYAVLQASETGVVGVAYSSGYLPDWAGSQ